MESFLLVILIIILSILLQIILIGLNKKLSLKNKNQIQNIHTGNISRLGGLGIIIPTILIILYFGKYDLLILINFSLISLLPALLEDLNISIKPKYRFILTLFSSLLIVSFIKPLPFFEFFKEENFFNSMIFQIIFYTFGLTALVNGQNFIDGTNGLSAFSALGSISCILFIGLILNDQFLIFFSFCLICLIIIFLIFNFPYGKIFLGDCGSYFLGYIIGIYLILIYGENPQIPTFSAALIIFYPIYEVIFSYIRKILSGISPFKADNYHLHTIIFLFLNLRKDNAPSNNSKVTIIMSIIWIMPLLVFYFAYQKASNSIFLLIFIFLFYNYYYLYFYLKIKKFKK